MATTAPGTPATTPQQERTKGRALFWAGIGACILGLVLVGVQFGLKRLFVPWYCPALTTAGALLVFLSVVQQRGLARLVVLVLLAAFAGYQWFFLASMMKLPDYAGPAQVGKQLPPFRAVRADGQPFTEADLHDGTRRVLTFFRGRW